MPDQREIMLPAITAAATSRNEIIVDATLRRAWPEDGQLCFRKWVDEDVEGYAIARVEHE